LTIGKPEGGYPMVETGLHEIFPAALAVAQF